MFRTLKNRLSGIKKALFSSVVNRAKTIGVIGFEPTASCSQSRRSSQAELHPEPENVHLKNNTIENTTVWQ